MAETEKPKKESAPTKYAVLAGPGSEGPWSFVGVFESHGQSGAKRLAAARIDELADAAEEGAGAEDMFFWAAPASAYRPQQPKVKPATLSF